MTVAARFENGPFDGMSLTLIVGKLPGYLMLMQAPTGVGMSPMVVGADFNDHWPGQERYDLEDELLAEVGEFGYMPTAVYRYVEASA